MKMPDKVEKVNFGQIGPPPICNQALARSFLLPFSFMKAPDSIYPWFLYQNVQKDQKVFLA